MQTQLMTRRYTYDRMTGQQLSAALDQLDLSMRQFARLSGAAEGRVEKWLRDDEDIPHHVLVLCSVLTLPGAMDMARQVTDSVVRESLGSRLVRSAEEARQIARGDIPAPKRGKDDA